MAKTREQCKKVVALMDRVDLLHLITAKAPIDVEKVIYKVIDMANKEIDKLLKK
jgi:hypothetical protein